MISSVRQQKTTILFTQRNIFTKKTAVRFSTLGTAGDI
jgi:hypothetical protein